MTTCDCREQHEPRRIVLTGGPGAGKTAVLELIRQFFCSHVKVLPEAAGLIFGGGFPREDDRECRRAAQRAIYYIQRELENIGDVHNPAVVLCDRGTLDGLAYWPGAAEDFWSSLNTTEATEFSRYDAVIHLRTPSADSGYNQQNRAAYRVRGRGGSDRHAHRRNLGGASQDIRCRSLNRLPREGRAGSRDPLDRDACVLQAARAGNARPPRNFSRWPSPERGLT